MFFFSKKKKQNKYKQIICIIPYHLIVLFFLFLFRYADDAGRKASDDAAVLHRLVDSTLAEWGDDELIDWREAAEE